MGTTSQKLTYLNDTKTQLKDMINYGLDTGEKITSETTFRNYVKSLFDAFIKTMTYPDVLYNNLPKVTGEGTSLSLNDTVYAPMKVELSPSELEQETTTGKQLFNKEATVSSIRHGSYTYNNGVYTITPDGTGNINLAISCVISSGSYIFNSNSFLSNATILRDATNTVVYNFGTSYSNISFTTTVASAVLEFNWANPNNTTPFTLDLNSLMISTSGGEYEPYTGGATPRPDYPQQIHTVSGDNTIIVSNSDNTQSQTYPISLGDLEYCKIGDYEDEFRKSTGKNLFDKDNTTIQNALLSDDGYYSSNNTNKSFIFECEGNTTYTISKVASTRFRVAEFESLPTIGSLYSNRIKNDTVTSITYTTSNNAKYLVVSFYNTSDTLSEQAILNTIQIEKGSTATEWEPYGKQWYLKKNVGKVVLDGSEEWAILNNVPNVFFYNTGTENYNATRDKKVISDNFNGVISTSSATQFNEYANYSIAIRGTSHYIGIKDNSFSTASDFKTWLSTHNTTVYYVLATPTYTLLNSTLQTQLDNIHKAISYQDQTNVSQTNNDLPFVIKLSAIEDLSGIFELIQG